MSEEQIGLSLEDPELQKRFLTPFLAKRVPPITKEEDRKPFTQSSFNIISSTFFWWLIPVLNIGYKRTLEPSDLLYLTDELKVEALAERFDYHFSNQIEKERLKFYENIEKMKDLEKNSTKIGVEFNPSKWATFFAVLYTFRRQYAWACIYMVISQLAQVCGPLLTRKLIQFVEMHALGRDNNVGNGVGYAIGTTILLFLSGVFLNHSFYRAMVVGIQTKAVLTRVMLRKSYKLSEQSRIKFPVSKITSIMGTDLSRVEFGFHFQPFLIAAPIPIGVSIAILLVYIGPASLVGLGVLVLFFIFMGVVAISLFTLRKQANLFTDLRIDTIKEVLNNLKIIKFFSWEPPYHDYISDARRNEMSVVYKMQIIIHILFSLAMTTTLFTSMASFLVLYAVGGSRDPSKIFASLSLFNILSQELNVIPIAVATGSDTFLGLSRVGEFLAAREEDAQPFDDDELENLVRIEKQSFSIVMKHAYFEWAAVNRDEIEEAKADEGEFEFKNNKKGKMNEKRIQKGPPNEKRREQFQISDEMGLNKAMINVKTNETTEYSGNLPSGDTSSDENTFEGLKNLNLEIKKGEFVVIMGLIGSGKSSLLNAMAGFMKRIDGMLITNGSLLFSGTPWIQSATVKENILFGSEYDKEFYKKTVWACSLESDLDILPAGDNTEIGEKGITLSGGQRARIDLARAVYADKDIVLLDDVLSAVDARVAKHIMKNCILGLLKNKTRILATHQLSFISSADRIIFLNGDGTIDVGNFDELRMTNRDFKKLMKFNIEPKKMEVEEQQQQESKSDIEEVCSDDEGFGIKEKELIYRQFLKLSKFSSLDQGEEPLYLDFNKDKSVSHVLMKTEEKAVNSIKIGIYKTYFREGSGIFPKYLTTVAVVLFSAFTTFCMLFTNTWLSFWVSHKFKGMSNGMYIGIYVMFVVLSLVFMIFESIALVYLSNKASVRLNIIAIKNILHTPMAFMDTTPMGRILNRFTKDTNTVDSELGQELRMLISNLSDIFGIVVLCIVYIPYFVIAVPILLLLVIIIGNYYQASAREVVRIEAVQRSYIYDNFNESLDGMFTIKLFHNELRFFKILDKFINKTNEASYLIAANQCWLGVNLNIVSSIFVLLLGLLCVNKVFNINAASTGLLLSYAIELVLMLFMFIRTYSEVENIMNSVERLTQYAYELPQEASYTLGDIVPDKTWPQKGCIKFDLVSLAYRPGLPLALKDVSVNIKGGEKIGICGRTGAGKSTIMNAIYRILELSSGVLKIDGVDISKLGLHMLRSKLTIIPQESVLFRGTIRKNLDPFGEYSDIHLWNFLKTSGIIEDSKFESVKEQNKDDPNLHKFHLDHVVTESGGNYSLGERQLVSFARAIVRDPKILILDEATSSVDYETDEKIQINIVKTFSQCTILCIAHRLRTILNYDRIIVMDKGKIKELDTPWNLFNKEEGIFQQMCRKSGIVAHDFVRPSST
ncbi:uncharacterized protein PRCAT00004303001 [Priceomyces carsonii]|uniref:uncharacterized protein n=1 Tax=Priceomyces carsonii TaxID=28549 RepID=UPI002ED78BAF|nr:unnamed protein product [Priceomyces carsonii]